MAMPVMGTPLPMPAGLQANYGSVGGYRENTGRTWVGGGGSYYYPDSYYGYSMAYPLIGLAMVGAIGFDGGGCGTQSASCGGGSCAGQLKTLKLVAWAIYKGCKTGKMHTNKLKALSIAAV